MMVWLTEELVAPAAVDLLSGYPVVVPGWAIQLRGVAIEINGLVDDEVHHVRRRLSFFLIRQT
jgi:hypothetical protein